MKGSLGLCDGLQKVSGKRRHVKTEISDQTWGISLTETTANTEPWQLGGQPRYEELCKIELLHPFRLTKNHNCK